MSYRPVELVRPDNIVRSGIIEPFNVVSANPVAYARGTIDPFIQSIRPEGTVVTMDGAGPLPTFQGARLPVFQGAGLGIISPEVIRTLSGLGLGQDDEMAPTPVPYADYYAAQEAASSYRRQRLLFGALGVALGVAGALAVSKLF